MSSRVMEPEIVFWETKKISDREMRRAIRRLQDEYDIITLEENHDVADLLDFYELTGGTGELTGAVSETKLEPVAERFEEHFEAVEKTVEAVVEREKMQMKLLQERGIDTADDLAQAKKLCRQQQKVVEDLSILMSEREEMLGELLPPPDARDRYEELKHETFVAFAKENPEVVFIALQTGHLILHSAYLLSEMDAYEKSKDAVRRSREALEQVKMYLDDNAPGEVRIDPDNDEVYTLLDKIEEKREEDD